MTASRSSAASRPTRSSGRRFPTPHAAPLCALHRQRRDDRLGGAVRGPRPGRRVPCARCVCFGVLSFASRLLAAIGVAAWLTVRHSGDARDGARRRPPPASWIGLVNRPGPPSTPPGADRRPQDAVGRAARRRGRRIATEQAERRWTAEAFAAQQQVLIQLARHGFSIRPDYSYARVLDGFSARARPARDRAARAQPARWPASTPVRAAYPASLVDSRAGRPPAPQAFPGSTAPASRSRSSTPASTARTRTCAAASMPGIDVVGGTGDTLSAAQPAATPAGRAARHRARRASSSARAGPAASAVWRRAPPSCRSGSPAGSRRRPDATPSSRAATS